MLVTTLGQAKKKWHWYHFCKIITKPCPNPNTNINPNKYAKSFVAIYSDIVRIPFLLYFKNE